MEMIGVEAGPLHIGAKTNEGEAGCLFYNAGNKTPAS